MSTEPTFPAEATPGHVPPADAAPAGPAAAPLAPDPARPSRWQTVGVGAAIGSAAIAAALLYANRSRKG